VAESDPLVAVTALEEEDGPKVDSVTRVGIEPVPPQLTPIP
jgi:hypothetical protein